MRPLYGAARAAWMIVAAALLVAGAGAAEEARTWTSRSGKSMTARFIEMEESRVVLENDAGQRTRIAADALCDADREFLAGRGVLRIVKPRTWTTLKGRTTEARFKELTGSNVVLTATNGASLAIPLAALSVPDRAYVVQEAPIPLAAWLPGEWWGWLVEGQYLWQMRFRLGPGPGATFKTDLVCGLTREEYALARDKKTPPKLVATESPGIVEQSFAMQLTGSNITFTGSAPKRLFGKANGEWQPDTLTGVLAPGGTIHGTWGTPPSTGHFYMARTDLPFVPAFPDLPRGKVHHLACGSWHYRLYIPKSYDPLKPAPVLVNDSAGANAQPLHTGMAEELGWIMIGLTESANNTSWFLLIDNGAAALHDLRQRVNLDHRRYYFTGYSGGARRSSRRALLWADQTAGLLLIAAGHAGYQNRPPLRIPAFLLAGESDMNKGEVQGLYDREKPEGRTCQIIIHPGGHTWGRAEDHVAGLRWLESQWKEPGTKP
jgi:predicted esterase